MDPAVEPQLIATDALYRDGRFGEAETAYLKVTEIVVDRLTVGSEPNEVVGHKVPGVVMDRPPKILGDVLGFRIGGLVSHQFFRDHAVTFDFTE